MAVEQDNTSEVPVTPAEYPDGPITCCLRGISKEVRVLRHRTWTVSLIVCCLSVILSLVFFLVAFSTTGWVRVEKLDEHPPWVDMVGLWEECVHGKCASITGDITGVGFKVSQTFAVLCLILILIGCVLTMKYTFSVFPKRTLGNAALALRFISFFFLLLLIPVFAMTWDKDHARYDKKYYEGHMDYSFILVTVTFVLEATGAFFTYCEVIVIQRKTTNSLLIQRKTVDQYDGISNEAFTEVTGSGIHPGGINLSPAQHNQERLSDQIRGRMNAKAAYEDFAYVQAQMGGAGVAGVAGPLGNSMFTSTEEIAKRFVGITLAEPPYSKHDGAPSSLNDNFVQSGTEQCAMGTPIVRGAISRRGPQDTMHMPQSVSMQNMYNENLAEGIKVRPEGTLVTSVSMYNLCDEASEKPYNVTNRGPGEKDEFSMRSWHPERDSGLPNKGDLAQNVSHIDPRYTNNYNQSSPGHTARENHPESQTVKPRGNRAPVQRRLDANRQANRAANVSPSKSPVKSMYATRGNLAVSDEALSPEPTDHDERINHTVMNVQNNPNPHQQYPQYENTNRLYEKNPSQNPAAPSRRKNERNPDSLGTRDVSNLSSQTTPLSHAQSNMSLHSVISTTSIVGGCAETEI